jgi:hypothetical protein
VTCRVCVRTSRSCDYAGCPSPRSARGVKSTPPDNSRVPFLAAYLAGLLALGLLLWELGAFIPR